MHITGGDWLELTPSDVQLQDKLGEGAFGEAYQGVVRVDKQWRECAVKKLKGNKFCVKAYSKLLTSYQCVDHFRLNSFPFCDNYSRKPTHSRTHSRTLRLRSP